VVAFGSLLMAFSFSQWFPLSFLLMALVGFTSLFYIVSSEVVLQTLVPDQLRGRVLGLYGMTWSLNPLGAALLGAVANFTSISLALGGGSFLVLLYAVTMTARSRDIMGLGVLGTPAPHAAPAPSSRF
jgi:MFS family permease